jgi:hypothetical protein
MTLVELMAACC